LLPRRDSFEAQAAWRGGAIGTVSHFTDNACRFNRSMQHPSYRLIPYTFHKELIYWAVLNQT